MCASFPACILIRNINVFSKATLYSFIREHVLL